MMAQKRRAVPAKNGWRLPPLQDWVWLAGASVALLVLRAAYLAWWTPYGLAPDEAQYWHWLSHNDWSFLTKPALTTWLMGVGTWLAGDGLFGVKLFGLLAQLAVPLLGFRMARDMVGGVAGRRAGWWAFGLLTTLPLVASGGLIMSPDTVLLPLWMGALYMVMRALAAPDERRALRWPRWLFLGVVVGLGGLAKYSAGMFYPLLGVFLLLERPQWLRRPQVWVAGVVSLALQLPVLLWNIRNDWVGVEHVLWQAGADGGDGRHGGLATLLEFLGGQALVAGPLAFGLMVAAWVVVWRSGRGMVMPRFLLVMTLPVFAAFLLMTFHTKVQANWPVLGVVPALVLVAAWVAGSRRRVVPALAAAAVALNALLSLALYDTGMLRAAGVPLKLKNDPTKDLRGWKDMGDLVASLLLRVDRPLVLSSRYQTAAQVAYHAGAEVFYLNAEGRRATQYDLWPHPDLNGRVVVYASEKALLPDGVAARFEQCQPWHRLATEQEGEVVRRMWLWVCWAPVQ